MAEKIYPKGIVGFAPNEKAPEFVLGTLAITLEDFKEWVNGEGKQYLADYKGKKQLKLNVLKSSKDNGVYFTVDTYKPKPKQDGEPIHRARAEAENYPQQDNAPVTDDDLPF